MTDFQIHVQIDRAPALVWSVMCDVENWPQWTPTVKSIRRFDHGPLTVGSCAVVRQPKLPPAKWRVTELDESARNFTWVNWAPGVRVIARHQVEPSNGGSQVVLSLRFAGLFSGLLARITRGLNDRYLALEAEGLKRYCESQK